MDMVYSYREVTLSIMSKIAEVQNKEEEVTAKWPANADGDDHPWSQPDHLKYGGAGPVGI